MKVRESVEIVVGGALYLLICLVIALFTILIFPFFAIRNWITNH